MEMPIADSTPRTSTTDWVRRHQVGLWRYLRFLGCAEDRIEDVMQDALIAALEHGVVDMDDARAAAWLRTTGRNLHFMHLRAERRGPRVDSFAELDAIWDAAFAPDGDGGEYVDALEECLPQLELRSRRALELRYREGASRAAMAAALEVSEAGVKQLLRRVRDALRRCIEGRLGGSER